MADAEPSVADAAEPSAAILVPIAAASLRAQYSRHVVLGARSFKSEGAGVPWQHFHVSVVGCGMFLYIGPSWLCTQAQDGVEVPVPHDTDDDFVAEEASSFHGTDLGMSCGVRWRVGLP